MSAESETGTDTRLALLHSATLLALLGGHVALALMLPAAAWFSAPIAGFAMACLLSAVHEAAHGVYVAGRRGNRAIGHALALLIGLNFRLYARDHMRHHKHLGTAADPEGVLHIRSRRDLAVALLYNAHALSHWRRSFAGLGGLLGGRSRAGRGIARNGLLLAGFAGAMLGLTWLFPLPLLLAYWLPLALSLVADNTISLTEHAVFGDKEGGEGPVIRTLRPGRLTRFLLYYVTYHREHHARPGVSAVSWEKTARPQAEGYGAWYGSVLRMLL